MLSLRTCTQVYHGTCSLCKLRVYPQYTDKLNDNGLIETRTYVDVAAADKFHMSAASIFDVAYLKDVDTNLYVSGCTFNSRVEVYNMLHRKGKSCLHNRLLETAWYLWNACAVCKREGSLMNTNFYHSHHDNSSLDRICAAAMSSAEKDIKSWAEHKCQNAGCQVRYVSIDGNEKLRRPLCAYPAVRQTATNMPTVIERCPNTPVRGNQRTSASKYCEKHNDTHCSADPPPDGNVEVVDAGPRYMTRSKAKELAAQITDEEKAGGPFEACKKEVDLTKYLETTAGMIYFFRPCGYIINFMEMFTAESQSQVALLLFETFHDRWEHSKFVGYDRSCDLEPFLSRLARKGNALAQASVANTKFVVDRFHIRGHTEKCCAGPNDAGGQVGFFHPSRHPELTNVNTEVCEQQFSQLNRFKTSTKFMSMAKRDFFLCHGYETQQPLSEVTDQQLKHGFARSTDKYTVLTAFTEHFRSVIIRFFIFSLF